MIAVVGGGAFLGALVIGGIGLFSMGLLPIAEVAVSNSSTYRSPTAEPSDSTGGTGRSERQSRTAVDAKAAADANSRLSDWSEIKELARRSDSWLVVKIETDSDGNRTARLRNEKGGGQFPEFKLAEGEGVPLFEYSPLSLKNHGWVAPATQSASGADRELLRSERETDIYRVFKLSDFGTGSFERGDESTQTFDHRHIWSPDAQAGPEWPDESMLI